MTLSVCPIALVQAPADRVWARLLDANSWWDARLLKAEPAGPPRVGQRLELAANPIGWRVGFTVAEVDPAARRLRLRSRLGLGVEGDHTITATPVSEATTSVAFG